MVPSERLTCADCGSKSLIGLTSGKSEMKGGRGILRITVPISTEQKDVIPRECYSSVKIFRQSNTHNSSSWKPGDWICPCGELNFSRREQCRKCNGPQNEQQKGRPGDWTCNCGENNFCSRQSCRSCGEVKGTSGQVVTKRAGDWVCDCGEFNFGNRKTCRKCDDPQTPSYSIGNSSIEIE